MTEEIKNNNNNQIEIPWSTVGYLTFKRTYARVLDEATGRSEEFPDTVERVLSAVQNQLNCGFTAIELNRLRKYMLNLKGFVAGRFLWQLGTSTVDRLGIMSLQNCASTVVDHPVRPFTWAFDALALGVGVGYNIQREYVYKLPPVLESFKPPVRVDTKDADFIIPDTREGWVKLLHHVLSSAFYPQYEYKPGFTFSTQLIRGHGAAIKGFGGVASGPEDLVWGILEISRVIQERAGNQLRPIDCLDIMNILGKIIVSGNVRRSAQIAIGDADDLQFLTAKNWSQGNIPAWRAMSNNSVVCNNINHLPVEFWNTYLGGSEPYGLVNLKLMQSCGRLGDSQYKDKKVVGANPCCEQSLEKYETCSLAEIVLPSIKSKDELVDIAKLLYRINKHALRLPCHSKETEEVVHRNMRMGIGVTGYLQSSETQKKWLPDVYAELRAYDKEYSKQQAWPTSIKLTTTKPSGTISLLPGVTPGVHPAYARYMIRRIRIAADHPLVAVCKSHGYVVEFQKNFDKSLDYSTAVVEFPFSYSSDAILAKDLTAIQQLEFVNRLQTDWSDNMVSCTVYYRIEELEEIKAYLKKNYNKGFKTISFLLHSDHGFMQAPYEEITEEEFNKRVAESTIIRQVDAAGDTDGSTECAGGSCPVR